MRRKPYRRQNSVGQNLIGAFTVSGLPTSWWILLCAVSTSSSSLSLPMRFRFKFFAFLFSYRVELSSLPWRWVQAPALALRLSHGDCDMQLFGVEFSFVLRPFSWFRKAQSACWLVVVLSYSSASIIPCIRFTSSCGCETCSCGSETSISNTKIERRRQRWSSTTRKGFPQISFSVPICRYRSRQVPFSLTMESPWKQNPR